MISGYLYLSFFHHCAILRSPRASPCFGCSAHKLASSSTATFRIASSSRIGKGSSSNSIDCPLISWKRLFIASLLSLLVMVLSDVAMQLTTGLAHHILVNSGFTRQTFINTFAIIRKCVISANFLLACLLSWCALYRFQRIDPSILYPCIELGSDDDVTLSSTKGPLRLLSINR